MDLENIKTFGRLGVRVRGSYAPYVKLSSSMAHLDFVIYRYAKMLMLSSN